jgi:hypothetical protein
MGVDNKSTGWIYLFVGWVWYNLPHFAVLVNFGSHKKKAWYQRVDRVVSRPYAGYFTEKVDGKLAIMCA